MLLTEQDAKTKWCWQPRNAENKCRASGCAMWRFWPMDAVPHGKLAPRTSNEDFREEVGYCGLAGVPLTLMDVYQVPAAQTEIEPLIPYKRPR